MLAKDPISLQKKNTASSSCMQADVISASDQNLVRIKYTVSEKDCTYFYFFSRCPVCGEWCKLH